MLDKIDLERKLSHETYDKLLPGLQRRLYDLEKACWDVKIASIFVFEGWDASGKGSAISAVTARLDPRGIKVHAIHAPRTYESMRPWLWRFWQRLPNYGEMAIFEGSWYGRVLNGRVEALIPEKLWRQAYKDITEFERLLADDGVAIVKFWLHISRKEQKSRYKEIEKNPLERWRVTPADWERHKRYNDYLKAAEEMFEQTETEFGPWTVVEATSKWYARRKIFETMISALEHRLGPKAPPKRTGKGQDSEDADLRQAMASAENG
jgi:polyphosphate kinase 2 (PPK2 family)